MAAPQIRRGSDNSDVNYDIAEEEEYYVTRPHSTVRRYVQPVQRDTMDDYAPRQTAFVQRRRASITRPESIAGQVTSLPRNYKRRSPWPALIIGMLLMIALVICFSELGSWWQVHQADATYGRPRTYQTNAVVGHQDSASNPSHFIFMNLNRHIIVIEFPGGNSANSLTYTGPTIFGDGGDLVPVTGTFKDVNGDGRPDMLIAIQGQTLVSLNTGAKFQPLQAGEQITV